jgi:hypothetical protein
MFTRKNVDKIVFQRVPKRGTEYCTNTTARFTGTNFNKRTASKNTVLDAKRANFSINKIKAVPVRVAEFGTDPVVPVNQFKGKYLIIGLRTGLMHDNFEHNEYQR